MGEEGEALLGFTRGLARERQGVLVTPGPTGAPSVAQQLCSIFSVFEINQRLGSEARRLIPS